MYISDLDLKVHKPFNNVEMFGMQSGSLNPKEAKTREEKHRKQSGDARRREEARGEKDRWAKHRLCWESNT